MNEQENRIMCVDDIARKLRIAIGEEGEIDIERACIFGSIDMGDTVCGIKYLYAPSIAGFHIGGVTFRFARTFEDA